MKKLNLVAAALIIPIVNGMALNRENKQPYEKENIRSSSEEDDFFSPIPKEMKRPAINVYRVDSLEEIARDYALILNQRDEDIVFMIKETNTFLARKANHKLESSPEFINENEVENIDDINAEAVGFPELKIPFRKGAGSEKDKGNKENNNDDNETENDKNEGEDDQWVEYTCEDPTDEVYPGYIPVSSCLSQELGQSGSVSFSFTFSEKGVSKNTFSSSVGVALITFSFTIGLELNVDFSTTQSIQGATQCNIKAGSIGQVFLKPKYISCYPKSRQAKWNTKIKNFLLDPEFKKYDKIHLLLEKQSFQMDCATNDVVDLFCDGNSIGSPDWESPLGIGYEEVIYSNITSFSE